MAMLLIVGLRAGAGCVITPNRPRDARQARSSLCQHQSGHHQLQFQQVSSMFPVCSVTYLPGCSDFASTNRRNFEALDNDHLLKGWELYLNRHRVVKIVG